MSVGIHMTSPASKGLFHRAIMESNPLGFRYRTVPHARVIGSYYCKALGCAGCDLTCLRAKNSSEVLAAMRSSETVEEFILANFGHWLSGFLEWTPTSGSEGAAATVAGPARRLASVCRARAADLPPRPPRAALSDVPSQVIDAFAAGRYHRDVPLLIGYNQDEGPTFIFDGISYMPLPVYDLAMAVLFTLRAPDVLQHYKVSVYPPVNLTQDARGPIATMLTDFWFRCASQRAAAALAEHGTPAYVYRCAEGTVAALDRAALCPAPLAPRRPHRPQLRPRRVLRRHRRQVRPPQHLPQRHVSCGRAPHRLRQHHGHHHFH